jgi:hypothetical protein
MGSGRDVVPAFVAAVHWMLVSEDSEDKLCTQI